MDRHEQIFPSETHNEMVHWGMVGGCLLLAFRPFSTFFCRNFYALPTIIPSPTTQSYTTSCPGATPHE